MKEPFSSDEKSLVRKSCLQLIIELSNKTRRLLTYLGLPSPWMGDVKAWRPYLGRVLAIEMEERFIPYLVDRAYLLDLIHELSYYVGDMDKILQSGTDKNNHDLRDKFPVDLVNLDYCSGLVYDGFERIAAIESLFRRQAGSLPSLKSKEFPYFLLFITHNSHHSAGKQKVSKEYIHYLVKDANLYRDSVRQDIELVVKWYLSDECPLEYRHKAFVFGKVLEFAQAVGFRVSIEAAMAYKGDNVTPMMHYQFKVYPQTIGHPIPVDSRINELDILNWPVIDVSGHDIVRGSRPRIVVSN